MDEDMLARWARVLVEYSLRIGAGQMVRIAGTELAAPLIRAVYLEVLRKGAHPFTRVTLDALEEIFFRHASDDQITFISELDRLEVERMDATLSIDGRWNTRALTSVDPKRISRRGEARRPLQQRALQRSAEGALRWCVTQYPSHAEAQEAEMSLEEYRDFVAHACALDREDPVAWWESVAREQARVIARLSGVKTLRIIGPDIDLTVALEGRTWINAAGEYNFPDGEIFTGPIESATDGHVRFTFPVIFRGREVQDVRLVFREGRVVEAEAAKGAELLHAMLDLDAGARTLGEFAFGLNYGIQRHSRNVLFDEKIGGTVHMALGAGYPETGSRNVSGLHWDLICDLRRGGEVLADGTLIYRDGRFV
ncbi:MAG: aminopeptidase [Armatimonadetes bacterium]|nr:aminopeptidase [Armatimonadota bacterium]